MTHPLAAYIISILNSLFLAFLYYNAKINFIKINSYAVIIGLVIIFLARGSFIATDFRTKREKLLFYTLIAINTVLVGLVFWEWYRD